MSKDAGTVLPSETPWTKALNSALSPLAVVLKPNSFGSWLTSTTIARPFKYPTRIGLEKSSARVPTRIIPATMQYAPIKSARMLASATAFWGHRWRRQEARLPLQSSDRVPNRVPMTMIREGPNTA